MERRDKVNYRDNGEKRARNKLSMIEYTVWKDKVAPGGVGNSPNNIPYCVAKSTA
jgi:hypothetical protein